MKVFGKAKKPDNSASSSALTDEDYIRETVEVLNKSWNILNSADNWKMEKETPDGDIVHSKQVDGMGRVFRLTGEVNFPPKRLLHELFHNVEDTPKWNPTMLVSKRVKLLDDTTDIVYQVSAPAAGGLVSSRDFVTTRHYQVVDGCYMSGGGTLTHPDHPVNEKYVRGESRGGCWVARPIPGVADRCTFQWLMNMRLNGWIPQYVTDLAVTDAMLDFIKYVRAYGEEMIKSGLMGDCSQEK